MPAAAVTIALFVLFVLFVTALLWSLLEPKYWHNDKEDSP
jgi:hypothetical protein